MTKCKITVLKKTFDEELALPYGAVGLTACPYHNEEDVFMPIMQKERLWQIEHLKKIMAVALESKE